MFPNPYRDALGRAARLPQEPLPPLERFMGKVSMEPMSGCWLWTGALVAKGYGCFNAPGLGPSAHRAAWRLFIGPIPAGMCVCHRCDNPPCVNPTHLFLGTQLDNIRDRNAKGRQARGSTHMAATKPERLARGERIATARLTEADVVSIRERAARGESGRSIARSLKMNSSQICRVIRRTAWPQVITP